jgi:general stress protein 26
MTSPTDRAWEIIEKIGVAMLSSRASSGDMASRPVEARPERDEGCIYVVTDLRSAKEHEIERDPHVGLTFLDQKANAYLALAAKATILTDPDVIKKHWQSTDSMWWVGPSDPHVCVIRAELTSGSLWDGPSSKAGEILEIIKAKVTGNEPNLGENRKADLSLGLGS